MSQFVASSGSFMRLVPKELFFDRTLVRRTVGEQAQRGLSRIGAFVRRRARSGIRRSKALVWIRVPGGYARVYRSSQPGKPPLAHEGDHIKRIFFAVDRRSLGVVIGPLAYDRRDVPGLLEYGGAAQRTVRVHPTPNERTRSTLVRRTIRIAPRPFMRPALAAEVAAGTIPRRMFVRAGAA